MEALREITEWKVDYRQPNHDYLLDGDKVIAYRLWSKGPAIPQTGKCKLDRRYRKFVKLDPKIFGDLYKPKEDANVIKVMGSKGNTYLVNKLKNTCTCAGFTFRGSCKHLKEAA